MPTEVIVAQPGTLTGSIGIFGGKIVIGGTLDKAGVANRSGHSGANADIYSPFAPFTPAQRAKVETFMEDFYQNFIEKVADSRKSTPDAITPSRRGGSGPDVRRCTRAGRCAGWTRHGSGACQGEAEDSSQRRRAARRLSRASGLFDALSEQFGGGAAPGSGACWRGRPSVVPRPRSRRPRDCSGAESPWR